MILPHKWQAGDEIEFCRRRGGRPEPATIERVRQEGRWTFASIKDVNGQTGVITIDDTVKLVKAAPAPSEPLPWLPKAQRLVEELLATVPQLPTIETPASDAERQQNRVAALRWDVANLQVAMAGLEG